MDEQITIKFDNKILHPYKCEKCKKVTLIGAFNCKANEDNVKDYCIHCGERELVVFTEEKPAEAIASAPIPKIKTAYEIWRENGD